MSFWTDIFNPVIQLSVYVFMIGGLYLILHDVLKKINPDIRWTFKYKIFRFNYKENDVKWCMDAIEKEMHINDVKKFLLLNGQTIKRTKEITYIFKKILQNMKGGDENYKQFKENNGTDEERQIPNYSGNTKKS